MKVEYTRHVKSITFEADEADALADIFEAARKWLEFGRGDGQKSINERREQISAMKLLMDKTFMALEDA